MTCARPEPDRPVLAMRGVAKTFAVGGRPRAVLGDVDLTLGEGEFVAIVGLSGSGKTTLLSILAGLVAPDAGCVELDDAPAWGPGPERGVVFQSYALLPWLTALDNVALAVPRAGRAASRARALDALRRVGLEAAARKRPHELSGGMRQRVALARVLAQEPRIWLLDEPLSALDALNRGTLQQELARLWERDRKSAVLITNDVDEALVLADRVLTLRPGPRGATLGASLPVPLARPRRRTALNHDPTYRKLRHELLSELRMLSAARAVGGREPVQPPVALRPLDLRAGGVAL